MPQSIQLELFSDDLLRRSELHELERRRRKATTFDEGWDVAEREERWGFE